jgi:hypothetical protein
MRFGELVADVVEVGVGTDLPQDLTLRHEILLVVAGIVRAAVERLLLGAHPDHRRTAVMGRRALVLYSVLLCVVAGVVYADISLFSGDSTLRVRGPQSLMPGGYNQKVSVSNGIAS